VSVLATDDFNRADAATLGSNWSRAFGSSADMGIFSNQVDVASANTFAMAYYNALAWPDDQYSQAKVIALASHSMMVICRASTATSTSWYGGGCGSSLFGNNNYRIARRISGGSVTSLASVATNVAANDVLKLECTGGTGPALALYRNGSSMVTFTDSGGVSSGQAGLQAQNNNGNVALWDDWEGGDFAAAGGTNRWLALLGVGS